MSESATTQIRTALKPISTRTSLYRTARNRPCPESLRDCSAESLSFRQRATQLHADPQHISSDIVTDIQCKAGPRGIGSNGSTMNGSVSLSLSVWQPIRWMTGLLLYFSLFTAPPLLAGRYLHLESPNRSEASVAFGRGTRLRTGGRNPRHRPHVGRGNRSAVRAAEPFACQYLAIVAP